MTVATAANIVNFGHPRFLYECRERRYQIVTVNVVPNLFSFITENAVRPASHRANHQIGKKTMQFGARLRRAWRGGIT
jgi:hypothetical protein